MTEKRGTEVKSLQKAQALQKVTPDSLTFSAQPAKFLEHLGTHLETLQTVYRTKLPAGELVIWRDTLKSYSYEEFERAMTWLISNPPRYTIDGLTQVWRGMPKLPDVIETILRQREATVIEQHRQADEKRAAEWRELEKRRHEHPEEFGGTLADLFRECLEKYPGAVTSQAFVMPAAEPTVSTHTATRERVLQEQAEMLRRKYSVVEKQ